jgi:hypothetical protein
VSQQRELQPEVSQQQELQPEVSTLEFHLEQWDYSKMILNDKKIKEKHKKKLPFWMKLNAIDEPLSNALVNA